MAVKHVMAVKSVQSKDGSLFKRRTGQRSSVDDVRVMQYVVSAAYHTVDIERDFYKLGTNTSSTVAHSRLLLALCILSHNDTTSGNFKCSTIVHYRPLSVSRVKHCITETAMKATYTETASQRVKTCCCCTLLGLVVACIRATCWSAVISQRFDNCVGRVWHDSSQEHT